jgi:class 3 adenylate cyclase
LGFIRLLTLAVVDYRGEVLNYVGDEVIVTWPANAGAADCRPLRCFLAMRDQLLVRKANLSVSLESFPSFAAASTLDR